MRPIAKPPSWFIGLVGAPVGETLCHDRGAFLVDELCERFKLIQTILY